MFEVRDRDRVIYFTKKIDADNYNDYLRNGLKVIRKDSRTYWFNNGGRLIDVSMRGAEKPEYVLRKGNRLMTNERLLRKYIKVINGGCKA